MSSLITRTCALRRVFAVGVGITKFEPCGKRKDWDYPEMVLEAATKALNDAKLSYAQVQHVYAGYLLADSTCGQKSVYQLGMTGIPVYNVHNNGATGATALYMARQIIQGGIADCVLAFGFEKMYKESVLKPLYKHCAYPLQNHIDAVKRISVDDNAPVLVQMFGNAGREHMEKYGTTPEHFQKIAYKNHKHSVNNPDSELQHEYSREEIRESPMVYDPLTRLQCCPISDGAAAVVMASEDFVTKHGLEEQAVEFLAMELTTDLPSTFEEESFIKMVGHDMIKLAADRTFENAGVARDDVDLVELHDCFSTFELISYEALGLCGEGEGGNMVDNGDNTYGGKYVVNPSGGLLAKGHPVGASGVAQCVEICQHIRNEAGKRQVPGAKLGLQLSTGLGGASVVGLYRAGFPKQEL